MELSTIGIAFIALGVVMLLVEASMPGFFIAVPATVLIFLGVFALVLPDSQVDLFTRWAPVLVIVVGVPATLGTIWLYQRIAPAKEPPITLSADSLVGRRGVVTTPVLPDSTRGKVKVARQVWSATAEDAIPAGSHVRVARVDGIILVVEPDAAPGPGDGAPANAEPAPEAEPTPAAEAAPEPAPEETEEEASHG